MSKQIKQSIAAALTGAAKSAIAATFADALTKRDTSGSLVTQTCETARKYAKGATLLDTDVDSVANDVASIKGWSGASARSRISECKVVLRAYNKLPEAVSEFTKKNAGKCQWHDSMKLARKLNEGLSVNAAIQWIADNAGGNKALPKARVAGALKAWIKHADCTKAEKSAIKEACKTLRIEGSWAE
jgi:hypothetical protein